MSDINERAKTCGYLDFMEKALTFPPAGKFTAPNDSAPGMSSLIALISRYGLANYPLRRL